MTEPRTKALAVTRRNARYLLTLQGRSAREAAHVAGYSHPAPYLAAFDRIGQDVAGVETMTKLVDSIRVSIEHTESGWIFDPAKCREIYTKAGTAERVAAWILKEHDDTLRGRCHGDPALYTRVRRAIDRCPDVTEEQRIEAAFAIGCSVEDLEKFRGRR